MVTLGRNCVEIHGGDGNSMRNDMGFTGLQLRRMENCSSTEIMTNPIEYGARSEDLGAFTTNMGVNDSKRQQAVAAQNTFHAGCFLCDNETIEAH
jgi:hypothetical protein